MAKLENLRMIREIEQNPFADPDRACNGGGYHQPYIEWEFDYRGEHFMFVIDDSNCGDFGERYNKTLTKINSNGKQEEVAWYELNTMETDACYNGPYGEGTFTKSELTDLLCEAGLLTGFEIDVPVIEDAQ